MMQIKGVAPTQRRPSQGGRRQSYEASGTGRAAFPPGWWRRTETGHSHAGSRMESAYEEPACGICSKSAKTGARKLGPGSKAPRVNVKDAVGGQSRAGNWAPQKMFAGLGPRLSAAGTRHSAVTRGIEGIERTLRRIGGYDEWHERSTVRRGDCPMAWVQHRRESAEGELSATVGRDS